MQKDLTASKKMVIAEEIEALPMESFFGVLAATAGVTTGASGELHVRGGHNNKISRLVDGLAVSNPFNTNGINTRVAINAIEELTVISGAFNTEIRQGHVRCRELGDQRRGGTNYDGSITVYGGDYLTRNEDLFFLPEGLSLNTTTVEGLQSGPISIGARVRFLVSGRYDNNDGHLYGIHQHLPSDSANFNDQMSF